MRRASARPPAPAMRVPSPHWAQADRALTTLERADPTVAPWRELLDAAFANLDELARLAADYAREVQDDPARLAELERRRDQLYGLFQKHGADSAAVLEARALAAAELDLLDTADLDLRALATRRQAAEGLLAEAVEQLTARRTAATDRLARAVNKWLPRLGLPGGKFRPALERLAGGACVRAGGGVVHGAAQRRPRRAAAREGGVGRRAVPSHAGAQGGAREAGSRADPGVRRGGPGHRRRDRRAGGRGAGGGGRSDTRCW